MATNKQSDDEEQDSVYLEAIQNLADLTNTSLARDNLGLGALATSDALTASDVGAYPLTGGILNGSVIANTTGAGLQKLASAWNDGASSNVIFQFVGGYSRKPSLKYQQNHQNPGIWIRGRDGWKNNE
ncbi:hypothetical protein [Erwinia typographi]